MVNARSVLIINPNSTESMTKALEPILRSFCSQSTTLDFFTGPSDSPSSINDLSDTSNSALACLPLLLPLLSSHHAFLVACYSPHPLVQLLKEEPAIRDAWPPKPVTGIFEASIAHSLQIIHPTHRFGIVTTGHIWESILTDSVSSFLGFKHQNQHASSTRFAGVETTGLSAIQLHETPAEVVRERMKDATKRLVRRGNIGAVCLGCAGMAGMDKMVREACIEELGEYDGRSIRIVDGVQVGVGWLQIALTSSS